MSSGHSKFKCISCNGPGYATIVSEKGQQVYCISHHSLAKTIGIGENEVVVINTPSDVNPGETVLETVEKIYNKNGKKVGN